MDSFEWNKIIGAVLATVLFVLVVRVITESVYHVPKLAKPAYEVEGTQTAETGQPTTTETATQEETLPDFAAVIPAADPAHGQQIAQRCAQCHDWTKGGPNKIGPNLYGVINRARGSHEGFNYSAAMKNKSGTWTYADLFQYLKSPGLFVPGNKMAFAGLPKEQDRLDLIAYMRSWADALVSLPPPNPKPAAPAATTPAASGGAPVTPAAGGHAAAPAGSSPAPAMPAPAASAPSTQPATPPH